MNVAEVVASLPQSSVAVNVTVTEPEAPQPSETLEKSFDQVTFEQTSEAEAPPFAANQLFKSEMFPFPSHCTVKSAACTEITGSVVS